MAENFAKGVRWDLSDLYSSPTDPRIESDLKLAQQKAAAFEAKYKPLFDQLVSTGVFPIADLLRDYKELMTLMTKPGVFAHLSFAENTAAPGAGAFMQKIQVALTDIQAHLLFFEVTWNKLDAKTAERLMSDPAVKGDLHFLQKMRVWAPHTLAEGEEKIMSIKSNTSGQAFSRLFDEVINSIAFYFEVDGKTEKKTEGEILSYFHSADRDTRRKASDSLAKGLQENTHLLTYVFNMILADHRASLKIRKYQHPMDAMNLSNEIDLASVKNLMQSVQQAYPLVARYYKLKKKLLGLAEMADYDRYATVEAEEAKVDFAQCREIVMQGYNAFSPEAGKIVEQFFAKKWIDAEVRDGKQGGGFCCETTPELHPYILVNYTGSMRDVMTVAHELGHGMHQHLSRRAGILESNAPLTMAECASVFGEMLIFEKILENEKDPKKRLALLCGKIDDNFATVYRQIAMTDFELMAHEGGLKEGELSSERLSDFWIEANRKMYGDSVTLTDNYRHGWKYIPHFVHSPFYCYAYAFAQLFVLALFQKYKEDPQGFIPKYFEMLSLGGSRKPEEIALIAGLDIRKPDFWKKGIHILEELVIQAETLAKTL